MILYVSTLCLKNKYNYSQILSIYHELGIKNVELGICDDLSRGIMNGVKRYDFNYIVHNHFPPPERPFIINLASQDKSILKRSIDQVMKSVDFCSDFNIKLFSFHGGFRIDPDINLKFPLNENKIPEYDFSFSAFKESVVKIANYAKERNVRVAVENNVLSGHNLIRGQNRLLLMCELWEFEKLFNGIPSDNLGLLLDIGHLNVSSNSLKFDADKFIYGLKDKTFGIHIHGNDGNIDEHRCISDKERLLATTRDCFKEADIPIVLECKCNSIKELVNSLTLLSQMLRKGPQRISDESA